MAADPSKPEPSKAVTATARVQPLQIVALAAILCVVANAAFFFLSGLYFDDKRSGTNAMLFKIDETHIRSARMAFAVFSGTVGLAAIAAALSPRWVGHAIAAIAGVVSLLAAIAAFKQGSLPMVLPATLFVLGLGLPLLAWFSLSRSRPAWAFLIATCAVYATVMLFGAPKVRGLLHIGLWSALIIPGVLAVAAVALASIRADYRDAS